MTDITSILARIADLTADASIDKSLYSDMVTYGSPDKVDMGRIAYAIRTHKVTGVTGDTLTAYAAATSLSRPSLAQWASAVGYLSDSDTAVTATTFGHALTVYNAPAAWKKSNVRTAVAAIAALPQGKRAAQWADLAKAAKAARKVTAPTTDESTTDATDAPTTDAQTRAPQVPNGDDIGTRTIAFVAAIEALAAQAGKGDETFIAPNNAQARAIENALAAIAQHVTAYVQA